MIPLDASRSSGLWMSGGERPDRVLGIFPHALLEQRMHPWHLHCVGLSLSIAASAKRTPRIAHSLRSHCGRMQ